MSKFKVKNSQINSSLKQFSKELEPTEPIFLRIPWLTRIFGCWHKKMGPPFTRGNRTYCTCMLCGACQKFDVKLWKSTGPFYHNPVRALYDFQTAKPHSKCVTVSSFEIDRWTEDGGQN